MKINSTLIKKAEEVFSTHNRILTGRGLHRKELRKLERVGLISKQLVKNKDTGQLIYQWTPILPSEGIVAEKKSLDKLKE